MATRNGTDIVSSIVKVVPDDTRPGSYNVISIVTTLEYSGASYDFAKFLASELRDSGTTYPVPLPDPKF